MPYYSFSLKIKDINFEIESEDSQFTLKQVENCMNGILKMPSEKGKSQAKNSISNFIEKAKSISIPEIQPQEEISTNSEIVKAVDAIIIQEPAVSEKVEEISEVNTDNEQIIEDDLSEIIAEEASGNFTQILQEKVSAINIDEEPANDVPDPSEIKENISKITKSVKEINVLKDFIEDKNPVELLDYLVLAAYYLHNVEMLDRYSLKQINSKIFPFSKRAIDHSVLQEAVSKNYIEVIPDYTGMSDVTEYKITADGEKYFLSM